MPTEHSERFIPSFRLDGIFQSGRVRRVVGKLLRNNPTQLLWRQTHDYANIGCGGNILDGFLNVDYGWRRGSVCWDITKGLPIKTHSLDGLFCEHALEHFEWRVAVDTILPEFKRVLRPGGTLRIVVPDAEYAIDQYNAARDAGETAARWDKPRMSADRLHLTPMAKVNNHFRRIYEPYEMGHKFMYDYQTLEYFLELSGFRDIQRTKFMEGRDARLLVDYEKRREESLYVEASAHAA